MFFCRFFLLLFSLLVVASPRSYFFFFLLLYFSSFSFFFLPFRCLFNVFLIIKFTQRENIVGKHHPKLLLLFTGGESTSLIPKATTFIILGNAIHWRHFNFTIFDLCAHINLAFLACFGLPVV